MNVMIILGAGGGILALPIGGIYHHNFCNISSLEGILGALYDELHSHSEQWNYHSIASGVSIIYSAGLDRS